MYVISGVPEVTIFLLLGFIMKGKEHECLSYMEDKAIISELSIKIPFNIKKFKGIWSVLDTHFSCDTESFTQA